MKTLLLKLSGPQQSWGTKSYFNTRHTDFHPSKSAIIGLIAASLGISRDDDEKINELNKLDFATRIDQPGILARDYHIAKLPNTKDTKNTERYYLEDAIFLVAISGENNLITKIEEGLKRPYFQQYLGRRSFPVLYDFILGTNNKPPIELLKEYELQISEFYRNKIENEPKIKLEIFADSHLLKNKSATLERKDIPVSFSQKNRRFNYRRETRLLFEIDNPYYKANEEHDAFSTLGDE